MYVGMRIIPVEKCLPGGGEHQSFCRCDRGVRAHQGVPSSAVVDDNPESKDRWPIGS